jgi:hypothetical protein
MFKTEPTGNKKLYLDLQAELVKIGNEHGVQLNNESADHENSDAAADYPEQIYYASMYQSACNAAGMKAEENGLDINALLGRVIY